MAGATSAVAVGDYGGILDALRGVRWAARRAVAAGAPGAHRSRRRGTAVEFTEYRAYRPGDDPRRLDWKLLARTDRAFVRLTDDHAVLPTTIVVDASASMAFPVATRGKWRLARELAVGLTAVAQASGDPVGLRVVSSGAVLADVRRTTRRGIVALAAETLARITPGGRVGTAPHANGRDTGRIIFISDFLDTDDASLASARAVLAARGEAYAVHVVAREELDPPTRAVLVNDPEHPILRRPLMQETRAAYLANFAEWRAELQRAWLGAGASFTLVATDEPAARAVRRIATPPDTAQHG
jgi:uncharacterized protein (DUF58 family)